MKKTQLKVTDYNPYYQTYIDALDEVDLFKAMDFGIAQFEKIVTQIPENKWNFAYAKDKWTVAEVLMHIIDTERVFQYRALCFSRNDTTNLPSFDENIYAKNTNAKNRTKENVLKEFVAVRSSTLSLFTSFNEKDLQKRGVASNSTISVGALGFIMCGHLNHHIRILKERYL